MNQKQREQYPEIDVTIPNWDEQLYANGEEAWYGTTLWEAAKDLPVYEVPLVNMDMDMQPWGGDCVEFLTFCSHAKLVMEADLSYPIILDDKGGIADGRHRLAKAIITGCTTIKVQRLPFMPDPDMTNED